MGRSWGHVGSKTTQVGDRENQSSKKEKGVELLRCLACTTGRLPAVSRTPDCGVCGRVRGTLRHPRGQGLDVRPDDRAQAGDGSSRADTVDRTPHTVRGGWCRSRDADLSPEKAQGSRTHRGSWAPRGPGRLSSVVGGAAAWVPGRQGGVTNDC